MLHLVRHARVTVRPEVDGAHWHLSPEGRAAADALAGEPFWADVDVLYSSSEPKAAGTAQRIAMRHGLPVRIEPELREAGGRAWVEGSYAALVRRYLAGEDTGWEPRDEAAARVRRCIERIVAGAAGDVAIVSHGIVLTLYVSELLGLDATSAFEVWSRMSFPDVCTVDVASRRVVRAFGAVEPM